MRRRSQILMFLLLVTGTFCAFTAVARAASDDGAVVSSPAHDRSLSLMAQVGFAESEEQAALVAEESLDSVTGKIPLASSSSTAELAVVNSMFSALLDCPRGGGQSLVNRHVRLQI